MEAYAGIDLHSSNSYIGLRFRHYRVPGRARAEVGVDIVTVQRGKRVSLDGHFKMSHPGTQILALCGG